MTDVPYPRARNLTRVADLPLPGHYECITLQANFTVHPKLGTAKFVVIARDPNTQVELARWGMDFVTPAQAREAFADLIRTALAEVYYLGGLAAATTP